MSITYAISTERSETCLVECIFDFRVFVIGVGTFRLPSFFFFALLFHNYIHLPYLFSHICYSSFNSYQWKGFVCYFELARTTQAAAVIFEVLHLVD